MRNGRDGFSLIEIVVVIAVISILASMAVPYAAKFIDQAREDRTRQEIQNIYAAVVGDPATQRAGYLGDMGKLPLTAPGNPSLPLLVLQGTQAGGGTTLGVRHGWNGPYLNVALNGGAVTDPWGVPYAVETTGAGLLPSFRIRSSGADRVAGNADDVVYPPNPVNPKGTLLVNLHVWDGIANQFVSNPQPAGSGGGGGGTGPGNSGGGGNSGNSNAGGNGNGNGNAGGNSGGGGGGGGGGSAGSGGYSGVTGWIRLHYANGSGADAFDQVNVPPAGPYQFGVLPNGYPAGLHAVEAQVQLGAGYPVASGQATVYIAPNGQTQLNLYVR